MKTADPELMRAINRFHVMDAIRRIGPVSRVEISERTELSPTTVSAITAALLDDRLITPISVGAVRDAGRGRPRVMLRLNPDAAHVVGVRITPEQITVATTNFCADVLGDLVLPIRVDRQTPSVIADLVEDGVRRCVSDAGLGMADISGVCVGLPGVVERAAAVCRQSPIFGERDVPLGASLTDRLGAPVSIDSDVNLAALAEHWFGPSRDLDDFLVVSVGYSLGLGILHNGELFRGANGLSPDLGDLVIRAQGDSAARLGDVASESAVVAAAQMGFEGDAQAALRGGRGLTQVLDRAAAGDAACARLLAGAGKALGAAVANLVVLFAPPKVIVAGRMTSSPFFADPLREAAAALLPPSLAGVSDIVFRDWSESVWVRGAAAMALRDLYGAPWGTTGPARLREAQQTLTGDEP